MPAPGGQERTFTPVKATMSSAGLQYTSEIQSTAPSPPGRYSCTRMRGIVAHAPVSERISCSDRTTVVEDTPGWRSRAHASAFLRTTG